MPSRLVSCDAVLVAVYVTAVALIGAVFVHHPIGFVVGFGALSTAFVALGRAVAGHQLGGAGGRGDGLGRAESAPGSRRLSLVIDGVRLEIAEVTVGSRDDATTSTHFAAHIPGRSRLELARRNPKTWRGGWIGGEDIFAAYLTDVSSGPAEIAVLTSGVRPGLVAVRRGEERAQGALVESGVLRTERPGPLRDPQLETLVPLLARLAKSLAPPDDVEAALGRNAAEDPDPTVRLRNLRCLLERYPGSAFGQRLLELWRTAPEPERRLQAAEAIACEAGQAELLVLAGSEALDAALRVRAIDALLEQGAVRDLPPVLRRVAASPSRELRLTAIRAIGRLRDRSCLTALASRAGTATGEELRAVATSLEALGDPEAEPALIGLLGTWDWEVRAAAARALRQVGTRRAVAALLPLAGSPLLGFRVVDLARAAIREIQARLGPGEQGELELLDSAPTAGALALAPSAGDLVLAPADDSEGGWGRWRASRG